MWTLRQCLSLMAALALVTSAAPPAHAQDEDTSALYAQPVLVLDPGMHTAMINATGVDAAGRWAVTASDDKTARIWDLTGDLAEPHVTIRIPAGPGDVGKVYAVSMTPKGDLVATGGWGRHRNNDIYLYDQTGHPIGRIAGIPNVVLSLAFSPNGRWLAAGIGGGNGIRIYDRYASWDEAARDTAYSGQVYGIAFSADGRLATSSYDSYIRLYSADFRLSTRTRGAATRPFHVAFSPAGDRLAVGYRDSTVVSLLDGRTLATLPNQPDTTGVANGNLSKVAWSHDGQTLFAAGQYDDGGSNPVMAWDAGATGPSRVVDRGARTTVFSLQALPTGGLVMASADPQLALLDDDGTARARRSAPTFDPRDQLRNFAVSKDGLQVDFGFEFGGRDNRVRFDLTTLTLAPAPDGAPGTAPPLQDGLAIENWEDNERPTLGGALLPLRRHELSRSLAIHPDGDQFILGASWRLRSFDADGTLLWTRTTPGTAWAVNITGDGRLVVAAYGDGTIRWHSMDDGRELLALFPMADRTNWVAWTPRGYYAATPGAYGVLKWHINRGWDQSPRVIPVSALKEYRTPDALKFVLQEMDIFRAIGLAQNVRAQREFRRLAEVDVVPGSRLHVVAVGVNDYGADAADLRLRYASKDAQDFASAMLSTQSGIYSDVSVQYLADDDASRDGILAALDNARINMERGTGQDVAVFHFSGHGALIDGTNYYLLPHGVDVGTDESVGRTAVSMSDLIERFRGLARHGRVLVLLDACHSGAATSDGVAMSVDGGVLKSALAGIPGVTVLTSSSSNTPSFEHPTWENGAFTEVLLSAFGKAADRDDNDLISMIELQNHMERELPRLTASIDPRRTQRPAVDFAFDGDLFVSGN